jgi:hypothetical protein
MSKNEDGTPNVLKAILTDVQFWIPALVLAFGVILLVWIHKS